MNPSTLIRSTQSLGPLLFASLMTAPLMAVGGTNGVTARVAFTGTGDEVSENCRRPAISADGRYVAFETDEALLPADDNGVSDIYVQDRETGALVCASVNAFGAYGNGAAHNPSISANGRCLAYHTASSAVGFDTNGSNDVLFIDLDVGIPRVVSGANASFVTGNGPSESPSISADGRHVAFESHATNIMGGDTNSTWDIYVRDMETDTMSHASVGFLGQANGASFSPSISGDGMRVAFHSLATNLAFQDNNGVMDVFVHRFDGGSTQLMSRSVTGEPGNDMSFQAHLSATGQIVVFTSVADDLIENDQNAATDAFYAVVGHVGAHLVSVAMDGDPADGATTQTGLSPDGRFAIFRNASQGITPDNSNRLEFYMRDLEHLNTWIVTRPSGASTLSNQGAVQATVSEYGQHVAFTSNATNIDPTDSNGVIDVFVRTSFEDPTTYCSTMTTIAGCEPTIDSVGTPSASEDSGFTIVATNVAPDKPSLLFYGFSGRKSLPFMGGTHCVKGSTKRSRILRSVAIGAGPCEGQVSIDMNAFAAGAIPGNPQAALSLVGQTVNAQFWGRDNGSEFGVFLSNAIEYVVGP